MPIRKIAACPVASVAATHLTNGVRTTSSPRTLSSDQRSNVASARRDVWRRATSPLSYPTPIEATPAVSELRRSGDTAMGSEGQPIPIEMPFPPSLTCRVGYRLRLGRNADMGSTPETSLKGPISTSRASRPVGRSSLLSRSTTGALARASTTVFEPSPSMIRRRLDSVCGSDRRSQAILLSVGPLTRTTMDDAGNRWRKHQ